MLYCASYHNHGLPAVAAMELYGRVHRRWVRLAALVRHSHLMPGVRATSHIKHEFTARPHQLIHALCGPSQGVIGDRWRFLILGEGEILRVVIVEQVGRTLCVVVATLAGVQRLFIILIIQLQGSLEFLALGLQEHQGFWIADEPRRPIVVVDNH